ncbi:chorismate mutase [Streptomyces swartbergensis]|uniref:chorismate mutase n=1 Tax=Streptomyces swartbergensis TaxID=487165 RepID=UPI0013029FA1|nr:chorismate mutase [Streptomyces swartbergensis]
MNERRRRLVSLDRDIITLLQQRAAVAEQMRMLERSGQREFAVVRDNHMLGLCGVGAS